ncbi:conserved phage C-terminal domain-containing protein [Pasteurella multocida]|nr:conserved phage C-terminal domain-containing protein [Pasteurella multocida]MDY0480170.1 conserved phage C-terminal domain-containing protein [Pasteurella multocida]
MRFTTVINNVRCIEWGINQTQGALFDLLNQASSWAEPISINSEIYYWVSREKIMQELPLQFRKDDTVYKNLKALEEKGLIKREKFGNKDLFMLTEKGKTWNEYTDTPPIRQSEKNPSDGFNSEKARKKIRENSEKNPTDKYININNTKINTPPTSPQGDSQLPEVLVLNHLNAARAKLAEEMGEREPMGFRITKDVKAAIKARLKDFTFDECIRMIDYLVAKWGRDPKMSDYLRPSTLFRPTKFSEYVTMSARWHDQGRPQNINGEWVFSDGSVKQNPLPAVEEVKTWFNRYLSRPNCFDEFDFSIKRNKILYWAVVNTKAKRPLEHQMDRIIAEEIKTLASRDDLRTPELLKGAA